MMFKKKKNIDIEQYLFLVGSLLSKHFEQNLKCN